MLVDCDSCVVRGAACGGCVVSVVLGAPPAGVELDADEQRALTVLADAGMVPRLRLVTDRAAADRCEAADRYEVEELYPTADLYPTDPPDPRPGTRPGPRRIA